jgi:SAM-dependent methyltransferase
MYDLRAFLRMVEDPVRYEAYKSALERTIRPGDVVLDLGAGTGIMTFLALAAGAGHVYAVETNPIVSCVRDIAKANGLASRVTVLVGDARLLPIPPVDVIVHDLRGATPLFRNGYKVVTDVRSQFLRPGGRMVPLRDEISLALVGSPAAHASVSGWQRRHGGADFEAVARLAAAAPFRHPFRADELLTSGEQLATVDYTGPFSPVVTMRSQQVIEKAGFCDGVASWFRAVLADGVTFSTDPLSPEMIYGQAYFPLLGRYEVAVGDRVEITMAGEGEAAVWVWGVTIHRPGRETVRENLSTLAHLPFGSARSAGAMVPRPVEQAAIDGFILGAVDGVATAAEIAARVAERFPDRFANPREATTRVNSIIERYGMGAPDAT